MEDPRDTILKQLEGLIADAATNIPKELSTSPTDADSAEFAMQQLQKAAAYSDDKWNMLRSVLASQLYALAKLGIDDMAVVILRHTLEMMNRYDFYDKEGAFRK